MQYLIDFFVVLFYILFVAKGKHKMKIINFRIAAFAAIGVICGILFSFCIITENIFGAVASAVCAIIVFTVFTFFSSVKFRGTGRSLCLFFFICCLLIGGIGFNSTVKRYESADLGGHILTVYGRVSEIGANENFTQIVVSDAEVSGAINGKCRYKIALTVYGENDLRLGDVISFKTVLRDRTLYFNGRISASSISQGIKYSAELNSDEITKITAAPNLFERCNLFIADTLKAGLKQNEFSIGYAMLTGNSDYISEENMVAYRTAGVAHIFTVSGLHIGFLATVMYFALNKLRVNRIVAFCITLGMCVFYAGICGFSASSLRAIIMFFFLNVARLAGLKYDGISSVFAAAFSILIVSPAQLFCVGFQLSFAVVFSVIVLYHPLTKLLKFLPSGIAAAVSVSFSAEVGGVPVLLYAFGGFPSLSLFVNLLFIPIAGIIFIALMVGTLLGGVLSPVVCLFLPEYGIFGLDFLINSLDLRAFMIGGFTLGGFAACYYGIIVLSGGLINLKKTFKYVLCIILSVFCVAGTWIKTDAQNGKLRVKVIGSETLSAVILTRKEQNALVISDIAYKTFSQYRLKSVAKDCDGEFSVILLRQEKSVDMLAMLVRLRHVLNVTRLYYYGEKDAETETVITKTFSDFTVKNLSDGDAVSVFGDKCEIALNGRCALYTINGQTLAVFSKLDGVYEYEEFAVRPKIAVCVDMYEAVAKYYLPECIISFRPKSGYADGETQGYLCTSLG